MEIPLELVQPTVERQHCEPREFAAAKGVMRVNYLSNKRGQRLRGPVPVIDRCTVVIGGFLKSGVDGLGLNAFGGACFGYRPPAAAAVVDADCSNTRRRKI
jgi:hypothetical protein